MKQRYLDSFLQILCLLLESNECNAGEMLSKSISNVLNFNHAT